MWMEVDWMYAVWTQTCLKSVIRVKVVKQNQNIPLQHPASVGPQYLRPGMDLWSLPLMNVDQDFLMPYFGKVFEITLLAWYKLPSRFIKLFLITFLKSVSLKAIAVWEWFLDFQWDRMPKSFRNAIIVKVQDQALTRMFRIQTLNSYEGLLWALPQYQHSKKHFFLLGRQTVDPE